MLFIQCIKYSLCFVLLISKKTFEDELFQGENPTLIENEEKTTYTSINAGNYHIHNTYFHDITSQTTGGAFYIYKKDVKILISESTFNSCSASPQGGAFAIYSEENYHVDLILSFVCGVNCTAHKNSDNRVSEGQFEYGRLSTKQETKGYIYDSSIVSNINNGDSRDVILHNAYDVRFHSNNITNNLCIIASAFDISPGSSCSLSYLLVRNNTAINYTCCFIKQDIDHKIESSNFLNNKQNQANNGVICISYQAVFTHCYIYDNTNEGNDVIIEANDLYDTIFNDCYIGEDQKKTKSSVLFNSAPTLFFNYILIKETNKCYGGAETFYSLQLTNISCDNSNNNNFTCKNTRFNCLLIYHAIFMYYQS